MFDIVIKNVDLNNKIVDIAIKDGIINTIKPNIEEKAKETIDATDKIVMSSFANMHTHASMSLLKGIGQDMSLMDWLQKMIWPLESTFISREFVKDGAELAIAKMIRQGTTLFLDMYFFEEEIAPIIEEANIRGALGFGILDFPTKVASTPKEYIQRAKYFLENFKNHKNIIPVICPHSVYTCSKHTLEAILDLANQQNAYIHMHISETQKEVENIYQEHGKYPLEYLNNIGLLNEKFIGAHGIYLNDDEIDIAKEKNITIVHCPESNLKLGSGIAPVWRYIKKGIRVSLGTDGEASNDNLSMLEEMSTMTKLQKGISKDPTTIPIDTAIRIATKNGFETFNIKAGEIKEGFEADIIILNIEDDISNIPSYSKKASLIYSLNDNCIETTISKGKILYHKKEFKTIDIEKVKFNTKKWQKKIQNHFIT